MLQESNRLRKEAVLWSVGTEANTSVSVSDGSRVNRLWQEWERFTRENAALKKNKAALKKKQGFGIDSQLDSQRSRLFPTWKLHRC